MIYRNMTIRVHCIWMGKTRWYVRYPQKFPQEFLVESQLISASPKCIHCPPAVSQESIKTKVGSELPEDISPLESEADGEFQGSSWDGYVWRQMVQDFAYGQYHQMWGNGKCEQFLLMMMMMMMMIHEWWMWPSLEQIHMFKPICMIVALMFACFNLFCDRSFRSTDEMTKPTSKQEFHNGHGTYTPSS